MIRRNFFFGSCSILAAALFLYGFKRYNGYDLESYFQLVKILSGGAAPYGVKHLSLYPPPGVYLLQALNYFPEKAVHFWWYVITVFLFFRVTFVSLKMFGIQTQKMSKKEKYVLWLSWFSILQGLGAQLEGGNINFALMVLLFEGINLIVNSTNSYALQSLGLFLVWMPVIYKPYLGLISMGLTLFLSKRESWKFLLVPALLGSISIFIPALFKGIAPVVDDFRNWLSGDVNYVDCAFTLKCNAVNYSIPSLLYHQFGWNLKALSILSGFSVFFLLSYSLLEKNILKLFTLLGMATFILSPASFPYTMMLLWFSLVAVSKEILLSEDKKRPLFRFWAGLFVAALVFLNPTYVGRDFFNGIIVPYRVTTFFVLVGLGVVLKMNWIHSLKWRRERDSNSR